MNKTQAKSKSVVGDILSHLFLFKHFFVASLLMSLWGIQSEWKGVEGGSEEGEKVGKRRLVAVGNQFQKWIIKTRVEEKERVMNY